MCDSGVEKDVTHFLVGCGGFERDWLVQLDDVCRIVGAESGWMDFESGRGRKGGIAIGKRGGGHM